MFLSDAEYRQIQDSDNVGGLIPIDKSAQLLVSLKYGARHQTFHLDFCMHRF